MTAPEEFGSYLIYEQLGVGGMASVHVAESKGLRKRVALKRLLPHLAEHPEVVRAFINEARLVGYLKHTNIAQTYDFGKVGETYFIAMELVPGPTLAQLIRQCKATVGVIPFPITLNILTQVCDALDYAHNLGDEQGKPLGLVHRDVSPPNVIVSNTGTVKLIDFGVAKNARSSMETKVGTVKGKFSYMAPEYLAGQLDSRVDLWALGAVAYELLTNRVLFDAPDDLGVIERVKRGPIPPPSRSNAEVPRELDVIVLTALERDPAKRWQSAAAMRTALQHIETQPTARPSNAQMIEWIEWAFTQQPGDEKTGISQLIDLLERPSHHGARSSEAPTVDITDRRTARAAGQAATSAATGKPAKTKSATSRSSKKRLFSTPRIGAAMIDRHSTGRSIVLWILLLAVSAGLGFAIYRYGIPAELTQRI